MNTDESERRKKVAEEKHWGSVIESIERQRKRSITQSIMMRLLAFQQSIRQLSEGVVMIPTIAMDMRRSYDDARALAPFLKDVSILVRTYNSIINDIHSHLKKKDSYVSTFSSVDELKDKPTITDVISFLYEMETNSTQMVSYLIRW